MVRCRSYLLAIHPIEFHEKPSESMKDAEILTNVRQLAEDLREMTPAQVLAESTAYKSLASVPGKGGALTQWFNRETNAKRKRVISEMMGLIARASYQQTPEFFQTTANELDELCSRLDGEE